jgi:hypothetical protein
MKKKHKNIRIKKNLKQEKEKRMLQTTNQEKKK